MKYQYPLSLRVIHPDEPFVVEDDNGKEHYIEYGEILVATHEIKLKSDDYNNRIFFLTSTNTRVSCDSLYSLDKFVKESIKEYWLEIV